MSNLLDFAKEELARLGHKEDKMQQEMNKGILGIVEKFSEQGHSGFSASYALGILTRLLEYKSLTPITGEEDEWFDVSELSDGSMQQNKRCSAIFRENNDNSTAYYIDGKVFSDDGGVSWWSGNGSAIPITLPFNVPEEPERIILEK